MEDLAPLALDLNCQTQYRRCLKEGIQCHPRMEELLHLKRTDPPHGTSPSSHHCHITKNQDDLLQPLGTHFWWCQKTWKSHYSGQIGQVNFLQQLGRMWMAQECPRHSHLQRQSCSVSLALLIVHSFLILSV